MGNYVKIFWVLFMLDFFQKLRNYTEEVPKIINKKLQVKINFNPIKELNEVYMLQHFTKSISLMGLAVIG